MSYDDGNIFARILRGEIPCDRVYEDAHVLAFRDIAPQAPVHVLVIPKRAHVSAQDFGANATPEEAQALWAAIPRIAAQEGLDGDGYRLIANTGRNGGQEVPHFHVHILGGRPLGRMVQKA
ncbi:MAG: histidine triad nucleotide-binding protein [Alphaproteobacteria bacterium]